MSDLTGAAAQAIEQPHSDVITILLEQHRRIRELFTHVKRAEGRRKQQTFDQLRILRAVHETAEEMVLRPVSCQDAGAAVADARNQEEKRGHQDAQRLGGGECPARSSTACLPNSSEWSWITPSARSKKNSRLCASGNPSPRWSNGRGAASRGKTAPTHPHPSTAGSPIAQWTVGRGPPRSTGPGTR